MRTCRVRSNPNRMKAQPHYSRWAGMLQRCYNAKNPAYQHYGGRGIRVCADWKNLFKFQEWCEKTYESGKTLDRKDNSKGYSPENCGWATQSEQRQNARNHTASCKLARERARLGLLEYYRKKKLACTARSL